MSGPSLLHNMSVPPRSTFQVSSPGLPGRAFRTTPPAEWTGYDPRNPLSPARLEEAFAAVGLPDLVGVFTAVDSGIDTNAGRRAEAEVGYPAVLALLARRSGHLYLPWRPVYPPLVPPHPFFLVFPEDGGRA